MIEKVKQAKTSQTATGAVVLQARDLVKTYADTHALDGVTMQIRTGESVAIMGASGSGKTTLLHCLAGIITPTQGMVEYQDGAETLAVNKLSESKRSQLRREDFGFVFQQGLLIPELTAAENVALALMLKGVRRPAAEQQAQHMLAQLGIGDKVSARIGQLSGGQQQRVAIARALIINPGVIFADEPTGALDSQTAREVLRMLRDETTKAGHALVVVTHDINVALACDRTIRLSDGKIIGELTKEQLEKERL